MGDNSLLERILYKKKYGGKVEKDGKVYVKYVKQRRFRLPRSNTIIVFLIIIALAAFYLFVSNVNLGRK